VYRYIEDQMLALRRVAKGLAAHAATKGGVLEEFGRTAVGFGTVESAAFGVGTVSPGPVRNADDCVMRDLVQLHMVGGEGLYKLKLYKLNLAEPYLERRLVSTLEPIKCEKLVSKFSAFEWVNLYCATTWASLPGRAGETAAAA
jgi:hypothetical protein